MCSPVALGALAGGSSVISGGVGLYNAFQQQAQYRKQAGLYEAQAGVYGVQAGAFDAQAGAAGAMGRFQGNLERTRAGQVETQASLDQAAAAKDRQQLVGAGKTAFAANGVLLEGRAGSAAAMWEQDESADLAFDQAMIKKNADNEIFGYLANADAAEAQGRIQAGVLRSQGAAARLNAGSSMLQADMARRTGKTAIINGYAGLFASGAQGAQNAASIML